MEQITAYNVNGHPVFEINIPLMTFNYNAPKSNLDKYKK